MAHLCKVGTFGSGSLRSLMLYPWPCQERRCLARTPNAERLTKHRVGVATRLKRIEVALEDLRDAIECILAERRRNDPQQDARQ